MGFLELSSYRSIGYGYEYYEAKRVKEIKQVSEFEYNALVCNAENRIYNVYLDVKHPRKSTCNCPHADGRMIICKHKIAVFFEIFPKEAQMYHDSILAYEKEREERYQKYLEIIEERREEIKKWVDKLSIEEIKERLISLMMKEYNDDDEDDEIFDYF